MAMSSGGGDNELNSEINVTPLVDVMLVLLIIFMITAPLLNNTGVSLELPQVAAQNIDDPEGKLVMSIKSDNTIYLGGTQITWAQLEQKLTKRGIPGVILDLEPHLKGGGQFGGFSGPDGMGVALRGLCRVLDHVGIDYHLRDFDDVRAARGF